MAAAAKETMESPKEDIAAQLADLRVARVDTQTLITDGGIREVRIVVIMRLSSRDHYRLETRGRFEPFKRLVLTVSEIREDHHAVVIYADGQSYVIPPITDDEKKEYEQRIRAP
jgi:hypothetical protein